MDPMPVDPLPHPLHVAVLALDDPWAKPHGGTLRTRAFTEAFAALGHEVTCVFGAGTEAAAPHTFDGVRRVPVAMRPFGERPLPAAVTRLKRHLLPLPTVAGGRSAALSEAIRAAAPDLLVVQQLRTAPFIDDAPGARLWFDQTDLWSAFAGGEIARRRGIARATATRQQRGFARLETAWGRRSAVVSAAGYHDATTLEHRIGRPVAWLPSAVPGDLAAVPTPARPVAGFFANFAYWPNRDAYAILLRDWLPQLRRRDIPLVVAGLESDRLPPVHGVEVLGPVAAPADFYRRVTFTVAPVALGGGIKIKVIESLMADRPVVAAPSAADGFSPHTRRMLIEVSLEDPGPGLDRLGGHTAASDRAALACFTPDGFTSTVGSCLEVLNA